MDDLETIRNRKAKEHQRGDVRKACEMCGLTPVFLQSALKKSRIEDLTEKELRIVWAYLEVLNDRRREKKQLMDFVSKEC